MGIVIKRTLTCDRCDDQWHPIDGMTCGQLREGARDDGWKRRKNPTTGKTQDVCPTCAEPGTEVST